MKKKKSVIILFIKELKKKTHILLGVNKNGFFTIYGLLIMQVLLSFISMLCFRMTSNLALFKIDNRLECAELYAIHKAKNDLLKYEEQLEEIDYLGYLIRFEYDDITCYITIEKEGILFINSTLEWDDVDNVVVDYKYLS